MKAYLVRSFAPTTSEEGRADQALYNDVAVQLGGIGVTLIDPAKTPYRHSEFRARFRYCLEAIENASFLLVDSRRRLGFGSGAEVMFGAQRGIIIVMVCPMNSHYRRNSDSASSEGQDEWIHPFVDGLGTILASDFRNAVYQMERVICDGRP